ncbi:MAG: hypothetical protein PF588_03230 [Candidatus Kapabacteria bacterium]|jgi:long-subunit fatty acid transport protein|nr:hypothetical protein [Candidatus Kapabacteria bacterium]
MTNIKFFRQLFGIAFLIIAFVLTSLDLKAQDDNYEYDDEDDYEMIYEKNVFVGLGHTFSDQGLSLGVGFRFWNFGFNMGFTGFASEMPKYAFSSTGIQTGAKLGDKSYPAVAVTGDFVYYYDFSGEYSQWTAFASIGYYSQIDSVLTEYEEVNVRKGFEQSTGMTFGLGAQYLLTEKYVIGLGYQSKVGIMATFGIRWE